MQEIRFHGRGGQGTVLASISLAKAFFDSGFQVQTFPLFGVERRGAPVEAYLRIDDEKILVRSNVYAPDHIVVMDSKLLINIDVTKGLKSGGWILLNTQKLPDNKEPFKGFKLASIDATNIALEHRLGNKTRPIINTAMMGAFAKTFENPGMEFVENAILSEVPVKQEENVRAAQDAFESVELFGMVE